MSNLDDELRVNLAALPKDPGDAVEVLVGCLARFFNERSFKIGEIVVMPEHLVVLAHALDVLEKSSSIGHHESLLLGVVRGVAHKKSITVGSSGWARLRACVGNWSELKRRQEILSHFQSPQLTIKFKLKDGDGDKVIKILRECKQFISSARALEPSLKDYLVLRIDQLISQIEKG